MAEHHPNKVKPHIVPRSLTDPGSSESASNPEASHLCPQMYDSNALLDYGVNKDKK